ncbi:MAG: hypothetical protein IJW08_05940, partial [Lentisphaeria bacterium]|nr:hypothetical protein [Lentisphaeria bacterium]
SRGVKNVSPDDAFHFALEIVRRKHLTALAARRAKRDNWLYDNILEYKWAVDFSGSSSFQIKLSPRFRGKDTSGTFWLGKKDKGTPVINLDELARYVADEIGGNELDIEQQLFDFYNDLTWVELRKEYTKYRKEMIAADRDADRQAKEEFLEQEKFRIQDEIVQIFSDGKPVVNEQWINENRDVFKELYKKIFPDRNPPYTPSQADIEAINMALVQESGNADVYAQAFKDAKEKAWQQYSGKLKELREKVLSSMTDAVRLQREAVAFAQKNLPRTNQSEFVRNIVGLLEYSNAPSARFPEGRRKTEFDKIIARMTERAAEVRKTELLDKIAKRLQQLGERTDSGRRVRGMRDIDTQRRLNRIIAISRLDAGSLNMAITENQKKIEELLSLGADTSELEYDIALLNRYGTLWNKSAGEVNSAFEHLQMLARSGKDNLLAEINKRAADDEYDRNELWRAVNGGRRYNDIEQKTLADKNTKSARAKKNLDKTFWQSLSFDGMLEAMALFANDENVVNRFRQMAHEAKLAKDVLNSSNSDDCHEFLKKLLKTKSPFTIAEKIGKWREIQVQTGVKRFVPDPDARQFEYERLSVDQARVMLQNYDAGKKNMPDYEAEAIRQQLSTLDRKIKYDVPEEFRDGATDQLMKIIRAENEGSKEPVVIIPRQTFNGASQEVPLTQMQALYLKLMWDQKDIRFKMHYNGYTQETMQQIDKFLLPEVKAFGAWMRSQLEADRSRIEEVYRQMYFAEFPKEDNYFPAVYKVSGNNVNGQSVDIAQPGSAAGAVAYTPGALKVRVYHLKAIRSDTDALTVFQNHRLMMNHFVTHAAAARKMRSVLLSSDVKNAIESEHGIVAYQELKTALQDFINGGNIDVDVNSMVSKIYGNAVRSKMAANVISGIKQTMGAISYLQEIPPDALAKGMAYAAAHPKEVWRTLGNTDYFRIRWNSGANADLRLLLDASGRDASMASVFFDAVDNISTLPLRLGDAASVLFGGFAVYKYHYDNLVKFGMDHAQARREALQKWEMATERTQQSSAPFLLNKFQRGGAESRIFTTFTSNQILLWNNYASAIYKSVHYGKTAPLKKAVRGIAALILSSAAMTVFDQMKEHYKDDKYQWGELFFNVLADAVTGFGPFGRIASEVISAAKPDGFMPSNFWSSDIIMGYYAVERQLGKNKKISDNAYVDAVRLLQAAGYFLKPAAQAGAIAREARKIYKISNEK